MAEKFSVFNKEILQWALDRANVSVADLKISEKRVNSWLSGEDQPTIPQAEELAKKLGIPLLYFCLEKIPDDEPMLTDFRTVGDHPVKKISLGLRKTIEHAFNCQDFLSEYLKETDGTAFSYKKCLRFDMTPEEGAKVLEEILGERKTEKNSEILFSELRQKIEKTGVLVQKNGSVLNNTKQKLEPREFRGFAIFDDYAPLIFINENDATKASIFTLIHEFCHILISSSGISGIETQDSIEKFCDKVAAEYLVPKKEFLVLWEQCQTLSPEEAIGHLAETFGVSRWVILRRAKELNSITDSIYKQQLSLFLSHPHVSNTKNVAKGGPSYNVLQRSHFGKRLVDSAVIAAYSGFISFTEAMRLTKLSSDGIEKRARELQL